LDHQTNPRFDESVEQFKGIFVDWLQNLQRNAIAENAVIEAEVIGQAFQELADHYKILNTEYRLSDDDIANFFKEEDK
jgi:hypothetical protein